MIAVLRLRGDVVVRKFASPQDLDTWLRFHGASAQETARGTDAYFGYYLENRQCATDCKECRQIA